MADYSLADSGKNQFLAAFIEVHPEVASYLIGPRGKNLLELEAELGKDLYIKGNDSLHLEEMKFIKSQDAKDSAKELLPVKPGDELNLLVQSKHNYNTEDGIARLEGYVIDIVKGGSRVGEWVDVKVDEVYKTYAKASFIDRAK